MKDARTWFSEMPTLIEVRAEKNAEGKLSQEYGTLAAALEQTFTWKETPEGSDYWRFIFNSVKAMEKERDCKGIIEKWRKKGYEDYDAISELERVIG